MLLPNLSKIDRKSAEVRLAQIGCPSISELSPDWGRKGVRNLFSRIPDLLISLVILLAVELPSAADRRAQSERQSRADDCEYQ
jgi:hypothetical protein